MQKYILSTKTDGEANVFTFLSKKRAFCEFIKAKKYLFFGDIKKIQLVKSITNNNIIHNQTIKAVEL